MECIAIDSQSRSGFDLDAVAGLKNLLDQLSFDLAHDSIVQVIRSRSSRTDSLTNKLAAKHRQIGSSRFGSNRTWRWLSPKLWR